MKSIIVKSALGGTLGVFALLIFYFGIVTSLSGFSFATIQFKTFWYYILALAAGFGIQISLYTYLKNFHGRAVSAKMVAVSGTTSGTAMISCCAHYLANILPVIGATGIISVIGQYQVEFFWAGLTFNVAGIIYIGRKIIKFHQP